MCELRSTSGSFSGSSGSYSSGPDPGPVIGCLIVAAIVFGGGFGAYKYFTRKPTYQPPYQPPVVVNNDVVSNDVVSNDVLSNDVLSNDEGDDPLTDSDATADSTPPESDDVVEQPAPDEDMCARLTESVGELSAFRTHFQDWAHGLADLDESDDSSLEAHQAAQRVLDVALPVTQQWLQWNSVVDEWSGVNLKAMSASYAGDLAERTEAVLVHNIESPELELIQERLDVLDAVASRIGPDGEEISLSLLNEFQRPEYQVPWLLTTTSGQRHYLPLPPKLEDGVYAFEYLRDPELPPQATTIPKSSVDTQKSGPSPTAQVAKNVVELLSDLGSDNWESTFYKVLRVIREQPLLDPLIKVDWLRKTLNVACRGSLPIREEFSSHLDSLSLIEIDPAVNPLDPQNDSTERIRKGCQESIDSLPSIADAGRRAADRLSKLAEFPSANGYVWCGWIHRGAENQWQCVLKDADELTDSELFVVKRSASRNSIYLLRIGQLSGGNVTLIESGKERISEGLPVLKAVPRSGASGQLMGL